jgi:two-component system NarL family sensor kinase
MPQNQVDIPWLVIIATIVLLIFTFGIITLFMRYQKRHNQFINEKKRLELNFQQELLQTQIEIQEQTLKTISQEIHDNIGQVLSLAKLNLNTFEGIESDTNQTKINDTKNLVSKAINDLRDLSRSLHGDKITELGLLASVENELKILQNTGQFTTHFKVTGSPAKMEPQKEMVLFRILQEGLNNAVKHSKAKNITVQMDYQPQLFCLTITDDGIGFNKEALTAAKTGIGLTSMKNRAALIGGTFTIDSIINNNTTICVSIAGSMSKTTNSTNESTN